MTDTGLLTFLFSQYLVQWPIFSACLVACVLVGARWQSLGRRAGWALAGFGLALAIVLIQPIVQTLLQRWQFESHVPVAQLGRVYGVVGFLWALLHTAAYSFLLVAVLADCSQPPPLPPTAR